MAISFISAGSIGAAGMPSTVIPTHAVGDLILIFALRDDATVPGLATGFTDIVTGGTNPYKWRIAYKYATSTSETYGNWGGAVLIESFVYRGAAPSPGINYSGNANSSGVFTYDPLTATTTGSWILGLVIGENNDNTGASIAPTGMTNRAGQAGGGRRIGGHDTNGIVASFAGGTVVKSGTNGGWRTVVYEIVPLTEGDVSFTEAADGYATSVARNKEGTVTYTETADTLTGAGFQTRFTNTSYTEVSDGYTTDIENGRYANIAYTEILDTVTSNLDLFINGSVAYTEILDTVTSASSIFIAGSVSYTEINDTVTSLVAQERVASVIYTEIADTITSAADLFISGSATYTEAVETTTSAATIAISVSVTYTELIDGYNAAIDSGMFADIVYTEIADTITSASFQQRNADATYTEIMDGYTADISGGRYGSIAYTEEEDTVTASSLNDVEASVTYTEIIDGYAAALVASNEVGVSYTEVMDGYNADIENGRYADVSYTEQADTLTSAVEKARIASASYTEAMDGYVANVLHGVNSTVTYTELNDTLFANIADSVQVEVIYTEVMDGYVAEVVSGRTGTVAYTEINDTVVSTTVKEQVANIVYFEKNDTIESFVLKPKSGGVVYTEAADTITSTLSVSITAHVAYEEAEDTLTSTAPIDLRACCVPHVCQISEESLVCNFVNLLPRGPMWNDAKYQAIEDYYAYKADPEGLRDRKCVTLAHHSVYAAMRLHDLLQNALWPALRESEPTTAYTTLDDWIARYNWVNCFYGACRDPDLGPLTPLEYPGNCETFFCDPETPEDLLIAVKHGIVVALSRLEFGILARIEEINWVIEPLGAKLIVTAGSETSCPMSFDIIPLGDTLPSWQLSTCAGSESEPIQAWFDPNECYNRGLPSKIWPGMMAAECIARSVMQRNQGTIINRIWC